jgi:hypothetical protein
MVQGKVQISNEIQMTKFLDKKTVLVFGHLTFLWHLPACACLPVGRVGRKFDIWV